MCNGGTEDVDYERSFPERAKLSIMGDTDNSKSETEAVLDYIRVGIN